MNGPAKSFEEAEEPRLEAEEPGAPARSDSGTTAPKLRLIGGAGSSLSPEQQALVVEVRGLVVQEAQRLASGARPALREELYGQGMLMATMAARRFDPSLPAQFSSYALPWIRGGMTDVLRREARYSHLLRAGRLAAREFLAEAPDQIGVPLEDDDETLARFEVLASRLVAAMVVGMCSELPEPEEAPEERVAYERLRRVMQAALKRLSKEESALLSLRFVQQRTHAEIAKELRADARTVRRHLEALLDKLRLSLAEAGITEAPRVRW
jgi:RNA polymerase sigma factor (sigma-70 family)